MSTAASPLLQRRIDEVVDQHPCLVNRNLRVNAFEDHVAMDGEVRSYYEKQVAQEALLRVNGVSRIINRLRVMRQRDEANSPRSLDA